MPPRHFYFCNTTLLFYVQKYFPGKSPQVTKSELNRTFSLIPVTPGQCHLRPSSRDTSRVHYYKVCDHMVTYSFILCSPSVINVDIWIKYTPFLQTDTVVLGSLGKRRILQRSFQHKTLITQSCFSSFSSHVCLKFVFFQLMTA